MTPFEIAVFSAGIGLILFGGIGGFITVRVLDWLLARELRREALAATRQPPGRDGTASDGKP